MPSTVARHPGNMNWWKATVDAVVASTSAMIRLRAWSMAVTSASPDGIRTSPACQLASGMASVKTDRPRRTPGVRSEISTVRGRNSPVEVVPPA